MGGLDRKIFGPRWHGVRTKCNKVHVPWPSAKCFPVQPDLTLSLSILSYDHHVFPFFWGEGVGVIKLAMVLFTHVAHFDWEVGIYIATKLFQFASRKEPQAILAGPDGFFRPCSHHCVRPSYADFLNSFAKKASMVPYRSWDNVSDNMDLSWFQTAFS